MGSQPKGKGDLMKFPRRLSLVLGVGFMAIGALTIVVTGCEPGNDFYSSHNERVVGEVEILAASYDDRDELMYFLITTDQQRTRLYFLKDPELMAGDKIEVYGARNEEGELLVENFAILVMQPRSLEVPGELRAAMEHKVAVLRLSGTSITEEQARSTIGAVDSLYRENSNGIDSFSGSVFGPYQVNTAECNTRYGQIRDDALSAFRAAGHNPDGYTHIAIVIPKDSGCGWGGLGQVGRPGKPAKLTWYNNWFDCSVVAHELGHNVGWLHSRSMSCKGLIYNENGRDCSLNEYGHPFDNMGNGGCNVHYSAPQKQYQGWLERCEDVTAGSSAVFNLSPIEGKCGLRSLRIPIPGEQNYYYVEYRQKDSGKHAGAGDKDAVLVSVSNDAMTNRPQMHLLDFTPATTSVKDAWLSVGTPYSLPGGIEVKLLSHGEIAKVSVTMARVGDHLCAGGNRPSVASDGSVGALCGSDGNDDQCPNDPEKTEPGICGCGVSDVDSDKDGTPDCQDLCSQDPQKVEPGKCGCGVPEETCGQGSAGLKGQYYPSIDFSGSPLERVDSTINFDWAKGSPDPQLPSDRFSVRWTGFIEPKYSETYTFYSVSDDGFRLYVDNKLVIDDWSNHAPRERSGKIALTAGKSTPIKVEYYENTGGAVAKLLWSSSTQAKQVVPSEQLRTGVFGGIRNIALNKPTTQSSTAYGGLSSRAVDGNTSGKWADQSVTHTGWELGPWWRVDLGGPHLVDSVTLSNRADCCSQRLANFRIEYLDASGKVIAKAEHPGAAGANTTIELSANGVHSVRVALAQTNYLSLAEVQVWGEP
jgi:hypothetical protein